MNSPAEESALEQCKKGNFQSFGIIYENYFRNIYNYIFYKTGHKETAEDLTSIVFTRALKKIQTFDPGKGSFSSWIYSIARNSLIDHYRSKKADINIDEMSGLRNLSDIPGQTDLKLKLKKVEEGLERLAPAQREVVVLRIWSGLAYAEIAEITKKTPAACKMAFSRAIAQLLKDPAFAMVIAYLAIKI